MKYVLFLELKGQVCHKEVPCFSVICLVIQLCLLVPTTSNCKVKILLCLLSLARNYSLL
jgi:hypothetical protein